MGLVAFVINAAMLLGTAWIVNQAKDTLNMPSRWVATHRTGVTKRSDAQSSRPSW